jgi:hypothetical protein
VQTEKYHLVPASKQISKYMRSSNEKTWLLDIRFDGCTEPVWRRLFRLEQDFEH